MFDRELDPRPEKLRGPQPVWVDLACVVDDARTPPTRYVPSGWDFSVVAPGELLRRMATAHGRWVALVRVRLVSGDRRRGTAAVLLVPERALSRRVDGPARVDADEHRSPDGPRDPG